MGVSLERVNCPLQRQELLGHVKPGGDPEADPGPSTSCRGAGLGYANNTAPWACLQGFICSITEAHSVAYTYRNKQV